jgi:hypothetical protein
MPLLWECEQWLSVLAAYCLPHQNGSLVLAWAMWGWWRRMLYSSVVPHLVKPAIRK